MRFEVRSVPDATRPMAKCTPRRKSMRILRLLEVSETRRASGVAWNAGKRLFKHSAREALHCASGPLERPCEVLTTAHESGVWAPPFLGYGGGRGEDVSPRGASSRPSSCSIRPIESRDPSGSRRRNANAHNGFRRPVAYFRGIRQFFPPSATTPPARHSDRGTCGLSGQSE